jgi:hypothetical protein
MAEVKKSESKGFGIAALVLGLVGVVLLWLPYVNIICAILAIIFGILAIVKTTSKGLGIAGLVLGAVVILIGVILIIIAAAAVGTVLSDPSWQELINSAR